MGYTLSMSEPDVAQKVNEFIDWVKTLDWQVREEVIGAIRGEFCMYCGGDAGCQCWNDE